MKISNLRVERRPGAARAFAAIAWEDCPRPPLDLFFETEGLKGQLRRIDRRIFGGGLLKTRRRLFPDRSAS